MYYRPCHHHIQLALKYARLGNINQAYLEKLLAPYTNSFSSQSLTYSAQPIIVENQFVLVDKWVFGNGITDVSPSDIGSWGFVLCPHIVFHSPGQYTGYSFQWLQPVKEFERTMNQAFDYPGKGVDHYCTYCPMDYSVSVSNSPVIVSFQAWHNLGTHGSPMDPMWTSHLWRNTTRPSKIVRHHHIPGSVRELCNNSGG
jgi:hypothetical protein